MRYSVISRRGLLPLSIWLIAAVLLLYFFPWPYSLPLLLLALLTAYLYRDLPRRLPPKPLAVLSPLDGRLLVCNKGHDPYAERKALHIRAVSHRLGPFVLRSPMEGKIHKQWFSPAGKDLEGRRTPPLMAMWIRSDEEDDVIVVISPRYRWVPIRCQVQAGERVGQGRRCGFIPLGATIEVFLPETARLKVEAGESVTAGDTILAELVHT